MSDHWKSLAQKLGAPGLAAPEESGAEGTSPISQESAAPPAPVEKPVAPPAPVETAEAAKPRKRSSWETLASMFNIQLDRTPAAPAEPVAPPPEPAPAPVRFEPRAAEPKRDNRREQPPRSRDDSRRGGFKRDEEFTAKRDEPVAEERLSVFSDTRSETNPALEALFGDAPREEVTSWKRTPRVVDDLGWDDDAPVSETREPISSESSPARDIEGEDAEEPRKRSRRRRRGSRKPRTEDVVSRDPIVDDLDAVDSGDPWVEPESFEGDVAEEPDAEPIDPERRSRRRRRRGRKRSSEEVSTSDSPIVEGDERPVRSADRADHGERPERGPRTERPERSDRRDRPSRQERGERPVRSDEESPREKRPARGDRPERAERPPRVRDDRPAPVISPEDEELDEMDEIDAAEKHRNIPNWVDSLQAIIEANIENHKRNDNRGGPPRGRPRSRR